MDKFTNEKYDLETRTINFSSDIIIFLKKFPKDILTKTLIEQCLRSATSVGANYREANGASSKKDFLNKRYICKKESKETLYWLELLGKYLEDENLKTQCRKLWQESKEFILIFGKISGGPKKVLNISN